MNFNVYNTTCCNYNNPVQNIVQVNALALDFPNKIPNLVVTVDKTSGNLRPTTSTDPISGTAIVGVTQRAVNVDGPVPVKVNGLIRVIPDSGVTVQAGNTLTHSNLAPGDILGGTVIPDTSGCFAVALSSGTGTEDGSVSVLAITLLNNDDSL